MRRAGHFRRRLFAAAIIILIGDTNRLVIESLIALFSYRFYNAWVDKTRRRLGQNPNSNKTRANVLYRGGVCIWPHLDYGQETFASDDKMSYNRQLLSPPTENWLILNNISQYLHGISILYFYYYLLDKYLLVSLCQSPGSYKKCLCFIRVKPWRERRLLYSHYLTSKRIIYAG